MYVHISMCMCMYFVYRQGLLSVLPKESSVIKLYDIQSSGKCFFKILISEVRFASLFKQMV